MILVGKVYEAQNKRRISNKEALIYFNTETTANVILKVKILTKFVRDMTALPCSVTHKFCLNVLILSVKCPHYGISTGGFMEEVDMENLATNVSGTLTVYWISLIHTTRKIYFSFPVGKLSKTKGLGYYFREYMFYSHGYYGAFQFRLQNINLQDVSKWLKVLQEKNRSMGSWNEASEMCKLKGGYLPIIRNREEQDEILGLL